MSFRIWLESTREYVKKMIDPALMTSKEYYKLLNSKDKCHDSDAYKSSEHLKTIKIGEGFEKINRIKVHGRYFDIYKYADNRLKYDYVKLNEDGEQIKDKNGNIVYYTKEELLGILGDRLYNYEFYIFDVELNLCVGASFDEWGCVLYLVLEKYKGMGFGKLLGKLSRDYMPQKPSGGFTPSGYDTFLSYHREYIRDYLESGMYSHLILTGQVSKERVKEVLDSVDLTKKKKEKRNLNFSNPSDWLLYYNDVSTFIIYDKKIVDVFDTDWEEDGIIGMIFVSRHWKEDYNRIKIFGGESDLVKEYLMSLALSIFDNLVVEPEDIKYVKNANIGKLTKDSGYDSHIVNSNKKINFQNLIKNERSFRKDVEEFGEFEIRILELAEGKYS